MLENPHSSPLMTNMSQRWTYHAHAYRFIMFPPPAIGLFDLVSKGEISLRGVLELNF